MNLRELLLQKAKSGKLAHFYIIEGSGPEDLAQAELEAFTHQFIKDYYQTIEGHKQSMAHLMDHPDVFVLGNLVQSEDQNEKFFTVEESQALGRFFEFKPVQSSRKFAVITEAHRINPTVANKWLKILEEPQGSSTIFLLNPRRQKLLETIQSRALHLRLPIKVPEENHEDWDDFLSSLSQTGLAQFLDDHVKGDFSLDHWVRELIRWESLQEGHPEAKDSLQKWLREFQEMEVFHQPGATKWTLFYSYLHEHVLPRLGAKGR